MNDKVVTILDFHTGKVSILAYNGEEEKDDVEMFLTKNDFQLSTCEYMTSKLGEFNLEIKL
jgi:hypothetical protein